ncbi:MAG: phospholipase D-like domain-containing protein [Chloroflexota bacterium]
MTRSTDSSENQRPLIGKLAYLFLLVVVILLGVVIFFDVETEPLDDLIQDVADALPEAQKILLPDDPPLIVYGDDEKAPGGEVETGSGEEDTSGEGGVTQPARPWYQIYFTQPSCPPEEERHGGIDEIVAADLLAAQEQVDIAAFDLDSEPIVNALIELSQQELPVRAVTDDNHSDQSGIRRMRRHGISVVEDKRRALMHNKFIILDQQTVWTGSLNFTSNGFYCNNNHLVRFTSPKLAENYRAEMDEMYIDRSFGPDSLNATPHEEMTIQGVTVENYFAPEKKLVNAIARTVARAQEEILFMAFSFTNEDIGEAMLGRAEAGVDTRGIFETFGATAQGGYYPIMLESGIDTLTVRTDGNPYIMHHKVIIVDRQTTVLGSFNFTGSANRQNDENLIIVHDADFTAAFFEEFERLWAETEEDNGFWNQ